MFRYELGKTVRWYFILMFAVLLIIKCITVYFVDRFDYSNPMDEIYNEYMEKLEGSITAEKEKELVTEWQTICDNLAKNEKMAKLYISGGISRDEYAEYNDAYMYAQNHYSAVNKVMEDYRYIKVMYQKPHSNIKPQFINSRYWDYFFDSGSVAWFPILLIIIISIYSSSVEQSAGMWNIINASYNGKAKILGTKMLVSAFLGALISFVFAVIEYLAYVQFFDMNLADAPIQSLQMFRSLTANISIGEGVAVLILWRALAGAGIALVSLLVAVLIRKDIISLMVMLAVNFVPVLLLDTVPNAFTNSFCGLYNAINPVLATAGRNTFSAFSGWGLMLITIVVCLILNAYRFGYRVRKY